MSNIHKLKKRVMRRIYYAYAIRVSTNPLVLHSVVLIAGVYGLSVMVHVASIVKNLQQVQVSRLDNFVFNAVAHTDTLTLLFFGLVCFTMLSLNWNVFKVPRPPSRMQTA